jgi:hypothetical protein
MTGAADPPRSRHVLRLIALERIARGVLLLAAGVYLLFHLNSDFGPEGCQNSDSSLNLGFDTRQAPAQR